MSDIVGNATLRDLWDGLAARRGDHEFLVFLDRAGVERSYTYREFDDEINRAANLFLDAGVGPRDKVAVHMHTCPEFMMCLFGLAKIGAVAVPMNEQYLQEECAYVLDRCDVGCAVVEPAFAPLYRRLVEGGRAFPQGVLVARGEAEGGGAGFGDFDAGRRAMPAALARQEPLTSDDVAEIMFTSGTTSRPKGVVMTHANLIYSGLYADWEVSLTGDDRLLSTMPACHSNFQLAALTPVLTAGATLVVVEKYSARLFWRQVRRYRATVTQAVAMMVRTLLLQPVDPRERDHCLREVLYFLPLADKEKEAFEERFGARLMNTYGSTESLTWVITDPPRGPRNWPSVGRAGLGYEAKIVDDDGAELAPFEVGEIWVRGVPGRTLMQGYYDDPEATARALDADGWLRTGDKGYVDESGWFFFVDRKANMIKRAGENISAAEVEGVLAAHPKVSEAAVIGVPDPIRDQAVKAFVLPVAGQKVAEDEIVAHCRAHLAAFKVPTVVEVVSSFPRTCSMKIEKKLLS